jgi:hypothetical protein
MNKTELEVGKIYYSMPKGIKSFVRVTSITWQNVYWQFQYKGSAIFPDGSWSKSSARSRISDFLRIHNLEQ